MAQGHSVRRRSRVGKGLDPLPKKVTEFTEEKPEKISNGGNGMAQGHSLRNRPRVGKGLDPPQKYGERIYERKTRKNFQRRKWNGTKPFRTKPTPCREGA